MHLVAPVPLWSDSFPSHSFTFGQIYIIRPDQSMEPLLSQYNWCVTEQNMPPATFQHHSAVFLPDPLTLGSGLGVFDLSRSLGNIFLYFSVDEKRKSKSTPVILAEIAKEEGLWV